MQQSNPKGGGGFERAGSLPSQNEKPNYASYEMSISLQYLQTPPPITQYGRTILDIIEQEVQTDNCFLEHELR
ncbi:unnamed protein product [Caretta caretta]